MAKNPNLLARDHLAQPFIDQYEKLKNSPERRSEENYWREINKWILPYELTWDETLQVSTKKSVRRKKYVLDSTAPRALELLASSLHGLLTPAATQWIKLGVDGQKTEDLSDEIQAYLEGLGTQILDYLSSDAINLYSHLHVSYISLGSFGTSVLYIDDAVDPLLLKSFPIKDVVVDQNIHGIIDTVFRTESITYRQAMQRWPKKDPEEISPKLTHINNNMEINQEGFDLLHVVIPTSDIRFWERDTNFAALTENQKKKLRHLRAVFKAGYIVLWINKSDKVVIDVGGQHVFPYIISRWYLTEKSALYGHSPGKNALPDTRMVNEMMQTTLRGAQKQADPPLILPQGTLIGQPSVWPGAINYTDGSITPQPLVPTNAIRTDVAVNLIQLIQESIKSAFHSSLLQLPEFTDKTAYEVAHRVDEQNRNLTPMILRIQEELIHPLIEKAYGILLVNGKLDTSDLPVDFDLASIVIEYENPIVKGHRRQEAAAIARSVAELQPWTEYDASLLDNFDPDKVTRYISRAYEVPHDILRSDLEVKHIRKMRADAQAAQAAQAQQIASAEAYKDVADADKSKAQAQNLLAGQ